MRAYNMIKMLCIKMIYGLFWIRFIARKEREKRWIERQNEWQMNLLRLLRAAFRFNGTIFLSSGNVNVCNCLNSLEAHIVSFFFSVYYWLAAILCDRLSHILSCPRPSSLDSINTWHPHAIGDRTDMTGLRATETSSNAFRAF